jgi:ParB-like chromosome segregation protein Spo0J
LGKIKNRIIGSGEEQLDQIMFNPRNWRIHPLSQQDALKGVLEEVGWVQQVIVNKRTGNLIDGHLRCQLAAREGATTIPVVYVDVSEEEEALVLATLDPIAAMAATDKQKLDELMRAVQSDDERVQAMISELAEHEGMFDLLSLDELADKYGETDERDFWPVIRVQVSPETMTKFKAVMDSLPGDDEAEKFDALVSGYELS